MLGKGLESLLPPKRPAAEGVSAASIPGTLPGGAPPAGALRESFPGLSPRRGAGVPNVPGEVRRRNERAPHSGRGAPQGDAIFHIEVDRIAPNPYQPRRTFNEEELEELAASIREFGVLQPLVVTKRVEEESGGTRVSYELIAGERRLLAAKRAGLERVPAIVRTMDSHAAKLEAALIENLQRSNLTALEAARAYARLSEEFGLTQREIAVRVGKSREAVANTLRLLQLSPEALRALGEGKITETQARALLAIGDAAARAARLGEFLTGGRPSRGRRPTSPPSPEDVATARALEEKLGAPVRVVRKTKGGVIEITFYSDEEYRGLRAKLLDEEW